MCIRNSIHYISITEFRISTFFVASTFHYQGTEHADGVKELFKEMSVLQCCQKMLENKVERAISSSGHLMLMSIPKGKEMLHSWKALLRQNLPFVGKSYDFNQIIGLVGTYCKFH